MRDAAGSRAPPGSARPALGRQMGAWRATWTSDAAAPRGEVTVGAAQRGVEGDGMGMGAAGAGRRTAVGTRRLPSSCCSDDGKRLNKGNAATRHPPGGFTALPSLPGAASRASQLIADEIAELRARAVAGRGCRGPRSLPRDRQHRDVSTKGHLRATHPIGMRAPDGTASAMLRRAAAWRRARPRVAPRGFWGAMKRPSDVSLSSDRAGSNSHDGHFGSTPRLGYSCSECPASCRGDSTRVSPPAGRPQESAAGPLAPGPHQVFQNHLPGRSVMRGRLPAVQFLH